MIAPVLASADIKRAPLVSPELRIIKEGLLEVMVNALNKTDCFPRLVAEKNFVMKFNDDADNANNKDVIIAITSEDIRYSMSAAQKIACDVSHFLNTERRRQNRGVLKGAVFVNKSGALF